MDLGVYNQKLSLAISQKLREVENNPKKTSQFRNLQVATLVPEMTSGAWQSAVVDLISTEPECKVQNTYAFRSRAAFVPFVYNQTLKCSLVICEPRHMEKYARVCEQRQVSAMYITNAKQLKHLQPGDQAVEFFNQFQVVIAQSITLKEIARLLQQQVIETQTDAEHQEYVKLLNNLLQGQSSLITILQQLTLPTKQPVFVTHECRAQGYAFQRVVIDPSALNSVKHEVFGKYLWIASPAFEFCPTQHAGQFWKTIRRFLSQKQYIQEVVTRMDTLVVCGADLSQFQVDYYEYARRKMRLPAVTYPRRMQALTFCNTYDVVSYQLTDYDATARDISTRLSRHSWLKNMSVRIPIIIRERLAENCSICFNPQTSCSVLMPCCALFLCFDCFYLITKQTLKCPTCRKAYTTEGQFALLSFILFPNANDSEQSHALPNKAALMKTLQDQYAVTLDAQESAAHCVYKLASAICRGSVEKLAICREENQNQTSLQQVIYR